MPSRLRTSLGAKLLVGELLVVLAGAITLLLTALSVGPGVFHRHVRDALGPVSADVGHHLDSAFGQSTLIALAIATVAAVLTALLVSWFVSRRVVQPIRSLAASARRIARGAYSERAPVWSSDELGVLAEAFNEMADSLQSAERRRRELLSDVAHELRTPLASIDAYLEGLADGVLPSDTATWATVRGETGRLDRLVEDLERVSRAEERQIDLRVRPERPQDLTAAAVQAAAPAYAAKHVELTTATDPHFPTVEVDRDRLGEVLANLLENALRHTPAGGRVTVRATADDRSVTLQVIDTGQGIAPENLERVFERFFRIDNARDRTSGGSGIGLAITRALVEAHGGEIHAQSDGIGTGSTFTVTLPAAGAPRINAA